MTNFEWIWKDNKRSKDLLTHGLAVNDTTGEVARCSSLPCGACSFNAFKNDGQACHYSREEWLNKEHEPPYKRGDIILMGSGDLAFVISQRDPDTVVVCNNIADLNNGIGVGMSIELIKQKFCNMLDYCDNEEV